VNIVFDCHAQRLGTIFRWDTRYNIAIIHYVSLDILHRYSAVYTNEYCWCVNMMVLRWMKKVVLLGQVSEAMSLFLVVLMASLPAFSQSVWESALPPAGSASVHRLLTSDK